jgi:hypothetical protein
MNAEMNNEQTYADAATDPARDRLRKAVTALVAYEITDAELDNFIRDAPVATRLFASAPSQQVNAFMCNLPDSLFWRLHALAQDFSEWADVADFETWSWEFLILAYALAQNETGRELADAEASAAGQILAAVVEVEANVRDGRVSYVEPYSLTSGRPPRAITAKWSETPH